MTVSHQFLSLSAMTVGANGTIEILMLIFNILISLLQTVFGSLRCLFYSDKKQCFLGCIVPVKKYIAEFNPNLVKNFASKMCFVMEKFQRVGHSATVLYGDMMRTSGRPSGKCVKLLCQSC